MEALEEAPGENYGIYWSRVGEQGPDQAMLFYTQDGEVIAGLALACSRSEQRRLLGELAEVVGGQYGYVTEESRPPDTLAEFAALSRSASGLRLVDGKVLGAD